MLISFFNIISCFWNAFFPAFQKPFEIRSSSRIVTGANSARSPPPLCRHQIVGLPALPWVSLWDEYRRTRGQGCWEGYQVLFNALSLFFESEHFSAGSSVVMEENQFSYRLSTSFAAISEFSFTRKVAIVRRIHGVTLVQKLNVQNATHVKKEKEKNCYSGLVSWQPSPGFHWGCLILLSLPHTCLLRLRRTVVETASSTNLAESRYSYLQTDQLLLCSQKTMHPTGRHFTEPSVLRDDMSWLLP